MLAPENEGHTTLILMDGTVHLHHARRAPRARARKTLCGATLAGGEQRAKLEQDDLVSLPGFNVCPGCIGEFQQQGYYRKALTYLSKAGCLSAFNPPLEGQLPLFDR